MGKGNLGDELMWDIFNETCQAKFLGGVSIDAYSPRKPIKISEYDAVVLGGGSIIGGEYLHVINNAIKFNIPVFIWGSGIDKLSKKKMYSLIDKKDHFNNYLNNDTQEKLKNIISYATTFGVRGPLTQGVMEQLQGTDKIKTFISGDPGLLLNKKPISSPINGFDANMIKNPTIAVNWGTDFNRIYGKDESGLRKQLVRALKELHKQGYDILLYSLWKRDHSVLQQLKEELTPEVSVHVIWKANQNEMMEILNKCEYSINFRLHANLISLAAGTPCVALGYRFKVYDFFHSIELPKWVLSSNSKTIYKDILRFHELQKKHGNSMMEIYNIHRELYKVKLDSIIDDLYDHLFK
ncbi:polysaccharide pyruvyl transferase family protein [Metabacillus halosaccharovorans]|uniref:polysaccharide pyruvyl transferase family protein n=1 Tax=Metabacillus halosaccharovorans TaxID=930124 RepID=UPI0020418468|nr:polysaccharide pyruvyl transferase family protein [Metabacillus halosaccharovorans]MCM3439700.1 polysaccharide pyruvyl transferase family protein [Metabacillus halosaccharovorans]